MKKPKLPFVGTDITHARRDAAEWNKVYMKNPPIRPITASAAEQDEGHSPIGFSGWDRHSGCHGSVALEATCPPLPESPAAALGTLAHSVAAYWALNGHAPKGADATMENNLRPYVYTVWDKLPKRPSGAIFMIEGRVAAPDIHPDCRGTVDALIWDDHEKVLQVHDLKYGKFPVSAKENQQLMGYAICAMAQWPQVRPKKVQLYIHQVRVNSKPDMWECDPLDLEFFEEEVRAHVAAIEEQKRILAETGDPTKLDLHAGDHCRYCAAWATCHERIATARREGIDLLMPIPKDLPPDAGKVIAFAKQALPWAKMVLERAKEHMLKNGRIPGVFLAKGKRVRVAKNPETFEGDLMADEAFGGLGLPASRIFTPPKPAALKTIPQLEKEVASDKELKKALGELWRWEDGAPVIALEGEDKEPYHVSAKDYYKAIALPEGEDEEDENDNF